MSGLRIAVPRGALFTETLDLLDRLGLNTREVRENDRKLLFDDAGIITMRPSDVPTYVEAGAADLGITGKDVLMEQSERELYELVDLGYGALHDGAGDGRRRGPRRRGAQTPGRRQDRNQIPTDRHSLLSRNRTPGRDRRGQGIGRAGAAGGARRGRSST